MAGIFKDILYMGLGLADYVRDKMSELQDELVRRGEARGEDLKEFLDDLYENIPLTKKAPVAEGDAAEGEDAAGKGVFSSLDFKGTINDILDRLGLATTADMNELKDRLDRLKRAAKSMGDKE
ncbi:MAG TPA: hypothetical protein PLQ76_04205 [bacterium]|nr:hypothetical protein [bacterium]